jgi:hypothetical protein
LWIQLETHLPLCYSEILQWEYSANVVSLFLCSLFAWVAVPWSKYCQGCPATNLFVIGIHKKVGMCYVSLPDAIEPLSSYLPPHLCVSLNISRTVRSSADSIPAHHPISCYRDTRSSARTAPLQHRQTFPNRPSSFDANRHLQLP